VNGCTCGVDGLLTVCVVRAGANKFSMKLLVNMATNALSTGDAIIN